MKLGLLVMVAVAVLLPSFSESLIVSRCELKDKLGKMINLPGKSKEKTLAKVICEVEQTSGLNTTLIKSFGKCKPKPTMVTSPPASGVQQMSTGAAGLTNNNSTSTGMTNHNTATHTNASPAITNTGKHEGEMNNKEGGKEKGKDQDKGKEDAEPKNLYGLFQLSDRKFCNSGYCPSENACHTSCTAFTDDDITDDIACVIQTGYWKELEKTASASCLDTLNFFKQCN